MASYSFSNISPVKAAVLYPSGHVYVAANLNYLKDNDLTTWTKLSKSSSATSSSSEMVGFRLFFNFNSLPNGKIIPDDATITSLKICPQSVRNGSSPSANYYHACGIRYLTKWQNFSNEYETSNIDG